MDIKDNLSEDEIILFQSDKLINEKVERIRKSALKGTIIAIIIFFIIYPIILDFESVIEKGIYYLLSPLFLFFYIIDFVASIVFYKLFANFSVSEKIDKQFLISNKKIYIYNYSYGYESEWIDEIKLPSIIYIAFRKRKWDQDGNFGTIEIISKIHEFSSSILKNVPNFAFCQKIIESILFQYGNIINVWQDVKQDDFYQFPVEIRVSSTKFKILSKKIKNDIYIIITCLFCTSFLIVPTVYIILSLVHAAFSLVIIIGFLVSITFLAFSAIDIRIMKKRRSPLNSVLWIESEKIILHEDNNKTEYPLNETAVIDFFNVKMYDYNDGIKLKPSYDSKSEIKIGPIEDVNDFFRFFFNYLLIWKEKHGYLLSKEKISEMDTLKMKSAETEQQKIIETQKKTRDFQVVQESDFNLSSNYTNKIEIVKNYLNPDENVLLIYEPQIKITKWILIICVGISIYMLILIAYFLTPYIILLIRIISTIIITIFCIFSSITLISLKSYKNSIFFFTNEKVIVKYSKYFCMTPYTNIYTIGRAGIKKNTYKIVIVLKNPIAWGPFTDEYEMIIPKVEIKSELIDQIKSLKKKYG